MQEKTANIVAQYVRRVFAEAHIRPYENRHPLGNAIGGGVRFEKLPEPGHWRVTVDFSVRGVNTQEVLCFEAGCAVEAIAVLRGLEDSEVAPVLTHNIAAQLVGSVRTAISTASLSTGYGPVTLPPLSDQQLASFVQPLDTQ